MQSIRDILDRPARPFNISDFGGLKDDEYIKDDVIMCSKCNTARLFVHQNFKVRCLCDCQAKARDDAERAEKERERQKEIERYQKASLIGERYKGVRFTTTETGHNPSFDAAYIRCERYCRVADDVLQKGLGIYLYGDKGTGKTHLTACMANELLQKRKQVLFTNFAEIARLVFDSWKKGTEKETDLISRLATIDFLFIDDLGTERVQGANGSDLILQEKIFDVLNKRYNNRKPTIFTSNHSIPELISERGFMEKTVDRITEMSNAILKIEGDSYRMKARAAVELPF